MVKKMPFEYREAPKDGKYLECQDVYKYLEYGMRLMGLRRSTDLNPAYYRLHQCWGLFVVGITVVYLPLGYVLSFLKDFNTMTANELVGILVLFLNVPAISMKLIILLFNIWRIDGAKGLLVAMYQRCESPAERTQVHGFTSRCHLVTYLYVGAYLMVPTLMYFSSVLSGYAPFNLYNPFIDWRESTQKLWMASTIEYSLVFIAVSCNIIVDCVPFIFSFTVRELLKLLIERVRQLREKADATEAQVFEELVLCVKDHKLILEYCNLMRPYVSRSLFVQFTAIGFVLACTLIHLIFFANFLTGLSSAWYMTACVLQSFPICYTCDLIIDDCDDLVMAIFHSNWISADRPYKLALIFFMQNVQQPIQFVGGGILPICLAT
ncbi:hypothetical protein KR222_000275, partial [Zaprionus bogoriensis]